MLTQTQIGTYNVYVHLFCSVPMSMLVEKPGPEMEKSQIKKIVQYSTILIVTFFA
jgi:hypothetical protein